MNVDPRVREDDWSPELLTAKLPHTPQLYSHTP